ncbi:phage protease [Ferriphaselus sp. R-1]|uniref:phage protease n=1 Tax=Ferriphaselus sp. R-1 TaxID=1485544 RepID=UPI000553F97C|nr:phage protease [Ferriphaselus sp. R-1]
MPNANQPSASFAALTFELGAGGDAVTTEAHLLPVGPFRSSDVRPVECAAWQLDASIAARVIERASNRKTDTLIDYEHQSLRSEANGQKVLAAGWIPNTLEWREGKGLYAINIGWTAQARREIADKQYRYISTVFYYNGITGEVLEIISVALTNTPGIDGLDALAAMAQAALSRGELTDFLTTGGADMALNDQQAAALTSERDGLKTNVAALTSERDGLKTQVAALTTENGELKTKVTAIEQEKAQAALATEKAKCEEMIQAALTSGVLTPAEEGYARKKTLADLTEYLDTKKPLAILNKQAGGKGEAGHGLNEIELAFCTKMGVKPEDYAKNKTA